MEMRHSDHVFDLFFENSIDLLCIADTKGNFIKLNPEWAAALGYSLSELEGRPFIEFVHPDDIESTIEATRQLANKQKVQHFVNRYRHKDGHYKWLEWLSYPVDDIIYASAHDLTTRLNAENLLKQSESRFRQMVENLPLSLGIIDMQGNIRYLNNTFTKYFGYELADIPTVEKWWPLAYPDEEYRKKVIAIWQYEIEEMLQKKFSYSESRIYTIRSKSGVFIDTDISFTIIGEELYVLFNDVTEKLKAENESKISGNNFANIFNLSPDVIGITRLSDGRVVTGNPMFTQITGYTPEEYIGRSTVELRLWNNPDDRDAMVKILRETGEVKNLELNVRIKSGAFFTCLFSARPIDYNNEECLLFVIHDISERKHYEEQLIKSEARLKKAQEIGQVGYSEQIINSGTVWASAEAMRIFGFPPVEGSIPFDKVKDCIVDYESFLKSYYELITEGKKFDIEFAINPADGSPLRYVRDVVDVERDAEGKPYKFFGTFQDITERKKAEEALQKRVIALTRPLDDSEGLKFSDLFDIEQLQRIQDTFSDATGVASIITAPDGTPITRTSNFCRFCNLIRNTEIGRENCYKSDKVIGKQNVNGPIIQPCLSGGLWDAGAGIVLGGKHFANWLIGQVRDDSIDENKILEYADKIGVDHEQSRQALNEVPFMSKDKFEKVSRALFVLANELSLKAYQNVQQARFIAGQKQAEEALRKSEEQLRKITQNIPGMVFQFFARDNGDIGFYYVSDSSMEYIGFDNEHLDGIFDRFASGVVEEDRDSFISSVQASIAGVTKWEYEGKYIKPDGKLMYFRGISQPKRLKDEIVFDGVMFDITQSKLAESELENTRLLFDIALRQTPIPIVVVSVPDFIVQLSNDACTEILGVGDEPSYVGKSLLKQHPSWIDLDEKGNPIPLSGSPLVLAMRGIETKNREYVIKRKDGTIRWASVSSSSIRDSKGKIIAAFLVFPDITERKMAEEKFKKLAGLNQTILDTITVGLTFVNSRKQEWVNMAHCKMFGYDYDEIVNSDTSNLYSNVDDYLKVGTEGYSQLTKGGVYNIELPMKRKDSSLIWCSISGKALDHNDLSKGSIWMLLDITERKRNESILLEKDAKLRSIFSAAPVAIGLTVNRNIQEGNDAFFEISGYQPEEIIGHNARMIYPTEEEYNFIGQEQVRQMKEQSKETVETRWQRKDGTIVNILLRFVPLDASDFSKGVTFSALDITSRKKAEEDLRKSQERFFKSFHFSPAAMAISEIDTGVSIDANQSFLHLFGYTRKEIIGHSFLDINIWTDDVTREKLVSKIKDVGHVNEIEIKMLSKSGAVRDILWSGVSIILEEHRVMLSYYNDITERKEAESQILKLNADLEKRVMDRTKQLQQANNDLEAFAYSVSHDLRSPLRHIDGFVKLLYSNIHDPDESINNYYHKIDIASTRLSVMIDELLTFSRLGRKELIQSQVDLKKVVAEVIDTLKPDFVNRNINWIIHDLPIVTGDRSLLSYAFENLISNAIKYTGKADQADIEIGTVAGEDSNNGLFTVFIKDNGVGFDMTYASKLFGVFQRLHTNDEFEGTGIGLANVKQIVTKHRGSVSAKSEINKGATFFISLPK